MIRRARRLPRAGFTALKRAVRRSAPHLTLSVSPAPRGGLAVIIPKKAVGRSVDRHLLKRRILSLIAPYFMPHTAIVVHAKAGAAALPFPALKAELTTLLATLERPL
jgi:ribonuclease P protein component